MLFSELVFFFLAFCDRFQSPVLFLTDFNLTRSIVEKRIGGWPQKTDLDAAVSAIFRLWNFYQFDLHEFLHGKIFKVKEKEITMTPGGWVTRCCFSYLPTYHNALLTNK